MGKKIEDYKHLYGNIELVDGKLPLHPLSDMTEEEGLKCWEIMNTGFGKEKYRTELTISDKSKFGKSGTTSSAYIACIPNTYEQSRYLLSKGFDLFGLIESGLAIDSTLKIN